MIKEFEDIRNNLTKDLSKLIRLDYDTYSQKLSFGVNFNLYIIDFSLHGIECLEDKILKKYDVDGYTPSMSEDDKGSYLTAYKEEIKPVLRKSNLPLPSYLIDEHIRNGEIDENQYKLLDELYTSYYKKMEGVEEYSENETITTTSKIYISDLIEDGFITSKFTSSYDSNFVKKLNLKNISKSLKNYIDSPARRKRKKEVKIHLDDIKNSTKYPELFEILESGILLKLSLKRNKTRKTSSYDLLDYDIVSDSINDSDRYHYSAKKFDITNNEITTSYIKTLQSYCNMLDKVDSIFNKTEEYLNENLPTYNKNVKVHFEHRLHHSGGLADVKFKASNFLVATFCFNSDKCIILLKDYRLEINTKELTFYEDFIVDFISNYTSIKINERKLKESVKKFDKVKHKRIEVANKILAKHK